MSHRMTARSNRKTRGRNSSWGFSAGLVKLAGTLLIPALVLLPVGGCSLAFVDGPASTPSPSRNACTTSYAAPALDLLGVPTTFLLGFAFGGFERSLEAVAPDDDDTFINLEKAALAASGTLLVSGVYGLVQVGRCRGSLEASGGPPLLPDRFGDRFHGTLPDRHVPAGRRPDPSTVRFPDPPPERRKRGCK